MRLRLFSRHVFPLVFCAGAGAALAQGAALPAQAQGSAVPAPAAASALPAAVEAALERARLPREALSVYVADVQAPPAQAPRLAWRAQAPVNPASVMKLVTTYAALDQLGPAFVWQTPVYVQGQIEGGALKGNVYIQGQGDPKLVVERLWLLLRRLQGLGITVIVGDVVLDRSAFRVPAHDAASFDGEPHRPYNAAPDALLVNFQSVALTFTPDAAAGVARVQTEPPLAHMQRPASVPLAPAGSACGDWRSALRADVATPGRIALQGAYPAACGEKTWALAPAEPTRFAARAIEGLWNDMGGRITGSVREGSVPAGLRPAFRFSTDSPPLAEVVRDINKYSNNVMAQQVFLTLAQQKTGQGSFESARGALDQWWRQRWPDQPLPVADNGAGLSREARIAPQALGRMLQTAWASPVMPELVASLPIYGVDGTLRRAQGRWQGAAHLKSGSLRDVQALAGYVHAASGRRYVLVAVVNHANAAAARGALQALVEWAGQDD